VSGSPVEVWICRTLGKAAASRRRYRGVDLTGIEWAAKQVEPMDAAVAARGNTP